MNQAINVRILEGNAYLNPFGLEVSDPLCTICLTSIVEKSRMQKVEIRIKGRMDEHWSEWFQDFEVLPGDEGETLVVGEVKDQAALYGLIAKMRDLGLKLILVNEID